MTRYCLPIQLQSCMAVRKAVGSAAGFAFVEVWASCIKDFDIDLIRQLTNECPEKLILVLHPKHGEDETLSPAQKIEILKLAAEEGVLVDVDIVREMPLLEQLKRKNIHSRLIVSHHNFSITPNIKTLQRIIRHMEFWNPAIYKIAAMCKRPDDAITLLHLLMTLRKENKRCIILGMGTFGTATRIFGTLWGNEMIFAPETTTKSSAPGQLTKHQLEIIFRTLEGA